MFTNLKSLAIPEGNVVKIVDSSGLILWQLTAAPVGLPEEYQAVEYVQAWHEVGAYIDLGFAFDTACRVEIGLRLIGTAAGYPFGAAENSGALRCMISAPYGGNGAVYVYGSTGTEYINTAVASITADGEASVGEANDLVFSLTEGRGFIYNKTTNESRVMKTQGEYTMANNLYLFAHNYNGSPRFGRARIISKFKYYDKNNVLICNLVPCYRKSDGEIGMYDVVRKLFLTNIGSGTFTKGADIEYEDIDIDANNWAFKSINEDGSIYNNGMGYKDGWRVRSGGAEVEAAKMTCTGFIPLKRGETLRIFPPFNKNNSSNAINFADANFTNLGQACDNGTLYGICAVTSPSYLSTVIDGISTFTLTEEHDASIAYVRITHDISDGAKIPTGGEMIITVEKPKPKNLLPSAIDKDGSPYNGGKGYKSGYKMSTSTGEESAVTGAYCSGFIPITDQYHNLYIKNITLHSGTNINNIVFYDADKTKLYGVIGGTAGQFHASIENNNGVYFTMPATFANIPNVAYFRFSCGGITDETIVTVNEEI